MPATILSTARLALRGTEPEDFDLLFANIFSDEQVMEHLSGSPLLPDQARALFDAAFDHDGTGRKLGVLVERSTEQVIGYAGHLECLTLGENDYELGFVLSRSAWGRGFATEIGLAQVEYGFGRVKCRRLLAQCTEERCFGIGASKDWHAIPHRAREARPRHTPPLCSQP